MAAILLDRFLLPYGVPECVLLDNIKHFVNASLITPVSRTEDADDDYLLSANKL